jgi:hypothetical protein
MTSRADLAVDVAWTNVYSKREVWPSERGVFSLRVGGYLIAVTLEANPEMPSGDDGYARAEFELTDQNGVALYEHFYWAWDMDRCGFACPDPLPNFNAATPFMLQRVYPEESPDVLVTTVHAFQKPQR